MILELILAEISSLKNGNAFPFLRMKAFPIRMKVKVNQNESISILENGNTKVSQNGNES